MRKHKHIGYYIRDMFIFKENSQIILINLM